jgi:hypothetical protein
MRPPRARLCLGEGARCSVLLKFLCPSKVIAETILNPVRDQRLDDLIAVSREVTTRGGRTFMSIFYRSDTIPGRLHSAEQWGTVLKQGSGKIWGGESEAMPAANPVTPNKVNEPIADFVFNAQIGRKISPLFGRWVLRSTMTTRPPLRTSHRPIRLCLGWGEVSTKGRSGDGMGLTSGPRSGERCTMARRSQMDGLPSGRHSWRSSSTSSPSNSSRT